MSVSFCLPHPVAVSVFMICRDLCACTEMLWMCVSFWSKVRPRTLVCVAMGSIVLCILRFGFSMRLFRFVHAKKRYICMAVCMCWLHLCFCVWM